MYLIFIAIRYLAGRAHEGGRYLRGAAAGIAISLVPIIVVLIVADGMIRGIIDRYLELGIGHIQVEDNSFGSYNLHGKENTAEKIREYDNVIGVWYEQRSTGVAVGKKSKTGVNIRAIEPSFWDDTGSVEFLKIISGNGKPENADDMLLGTGIADFIGADVGDTVRLMTMRVGQSGRNVPVVTPFTVTGIVSSGYHELDALWCIINDEGGKRIQTAEYSSYIVKIKDPYRNADSFSEFLQEELGHFYNVITWKGLMGSQYNSYQSTRQMLLFIMALIVIVAAVNVSSATSMLVIERHQDIAILKASGSSKASISGIFLWSSLFTGLCGAAAGSITGLLIGYFINPVIRSLEIIISFFSGLFGGGNVKILDPGFYLETIPVIIDWYAIMLIFGFTILCSIIASMLPAIRAGKLKPMDLFRKN